MAQGADADAGTLEDTAVTFGLFDERPATAEDCETEWAQEYRIEVGDLITSRSAALKAWLEGAP